MVEAIERVWVLLGLVLLLPLMVAIAIAIKFEAVRSSPARGPIFFREDRISRGTVFHLIKFRILNADALGALSIGPTHIKRLEGGEENLTRVGRFLKRFYLDELPQVFNILKGEMTLVGTRPWPIEIYREEMATGITRKRDMPAGLLGPVQAAKGDENSPSGVALDLEYLDAYRSLPAYRLLLLDARITIKCLRVMFEGKGL